jgi:hypothetical protein
MKNLKLLTASIVLTCFAMFPVTALADEDLDVTMDVIENLSEVEGVILEMSTEADEVDGDHYDAEEGDGGGDYAEGDDYVDHDDEVEGIFADVPGDDGFEHDDEAGYDEDGMHEEDGHDEGDEVDTDEPVDEEHDGAAEGDGADVAGSEG